MTATTVIRKLDWAAIWDPERASHRYARQIDLAWQGNSLVHVGPDYDGPADEEIDGRGLFALPGLVDVHSHPASEPLDKGFNEELGSPRLGMSGLYEYMPVMRADPEGTAACAEVAYSELLLSGVTTLVDLSLAWDGWLDLFARSGLRGVLAPMYRSARWYTPNGHRVDYDWDEKAGLAGLEDAVRLIERARQHESGRMGGMLSPAQIDTCSEDLLRRSIATAREKDWPIQIHASQSVVEFNEMTRRHGVTPLQWLDSVDFLEERTTIAHCIFIDDHSWVRWHTQDDLALLAERDVGVAHCPNVFVRRGILLESFGRYREAGLRIGLGTDTYPHNFLDEMRWACALGRVAEEHVETAHTGDILHAATVGGAAVLRRDDIGRLATGCKADLVLVDLEHPAMKPGRDPLRALVWSAQDRAVRHVYVDGVQVVRDSRVLTLDREDASARLHEAQVRAMERAPDLDWAKRPMQQISPLSLPLEDTP